MANHNLGEKKGKSVIAYANYEQLQKMEKIKEITGDCSLSLLIRKAIDSYYEKLTNRS